MAEQLIELNKNIGGGAGGYLEDLKDVNITNISDGDIISYDSTNQEYINQPKSLYPQSVELTYAEYQALENNNQLDPTTEYFITDIDVAEAYYVETAGQTASTGATTLTFTNSHITPTSDIRILAEPDSCKVSTNPQYKVKAKISSCGDGTATITFPALAENTTFWLLINCPILTNMDVETEIDNLKNKDTITQFAVSITGWTANTTIQPGTTLYQKTIDINNYYLDTDKNEVPKISIGSTGTLPTLAEQTSYNLLQYVTVDPDVPCLYLYASAVPTTAFYINVEGAD